MDSIDENNVLAKRLSIIAPSLFLLNLLLLPGIAFLCLTYLFLKYRRINVTAARIQLQQNFYASIASGIAIVGISILIILIGGLSSMYSWMLMLTYALSIHASLVLLGAFALSKGINQQAYIYPGLSYFSKKENSS